MAQQRVAFVTDDGVTISSHFGRAEFYEICTIDGPSVVGRVRLPKPGHHREGQQHQVGHGGGHSADHGDMISPIKDCTILVARGMGMGAHTALASAGIATILTDEHTIDEAIQQLVDGRLSSNDRRLHDHGPGHAN